MNESQWGLPNAKTGLRTFRTSRNGGARFSELALTVNIYNCRCLHHFSDVLLCLFFWWTPSWYIFPDVGPWSRLHGFVYPCVNWEVGHDPLIPLSIHFPRRFLTATGMAAGSCVVLLTSFPNCGSKREARSRVPRVQWVQHPFNLSMPKRTPQSHGHLPNIWDVFWYICYIVC